MEFFFGLLALWFIHEWLEFAFKFNCSADVPKMPKDQKKHWWSSRGGEDSGLRVYVDNATGVHYIKSSIFERMQVRINKDGTPYTGE